jgi:hypothetical protein
MAMEFQVITSHQFFRLGAHGELDWTASLQVLAMLVKSFDERATPLALIDLRDAEADMNVAQVESLAELLEHAGLREYHRVAILHKKRPQSMAAEFVEAARDLGFDIANFDVYEDAVEWLSSVDEPDPDFDAETYEGPSNEANPAVRPPPPPSPPDKAS